MMEKTGILERVSAGGIGKGASLVTIHVRFQDDDESRHVENFVMKRGVDISDKDLLGLFNKVGQEITMKVNVEIQI